MGGLRVSLERAAKSSRRWSAFHLHWPGELRPVLLQAVAPAVAQLQGDGVVRGFFFIRYWEGGQHLRLRFNRAPEVTEEHLEEHLRRRLSGRLDPLLAGDSGGAGPGQPPGTLVARPYEPETFRYGGSAGLAVAEACFEASSRFVLDRLAALPPESEAVQGFALGLLLVSAHAFGLTRAQAASFLDAVSIDGFRNLAAAGRWEGDEVPLEERLIQAFAASYERQCVALAQTLGSLWPRLDAGERGDWVSWYELRRWAAARYLEIQNRGALEGRPDRRWPAGGSDGGACAPVAGILFDLLHMTQNRLGLDNHAEIYLAYVAARLLGQGEDGG